MKEATIITNVLFTEEQEDRILCQLADAGIENTNFDYRITTEEAKEALTKYFPDRHITFIHSTKGGKK